MGFPGPTWQLPSRLHCFCGDPRAYRKNTSSEYYRPTSFPCRPQEGAGICMRRCPLYVGEWVRFTLHTRPALLDPHLDNQEPMDWPYIIRRACNRPLGTLKRSRAITKCGNGFQYYILSCKQRVTTITAGQLGNHALPPPPPPIKSVI